MNTLSLYYKHAVCRNGNVCTLKDFMAQQLLVGFLNFHKTLNKICIVSKVGNFAQQFQMGNPVFADFVGDKSRQIRISMQKPASWRNAVGNIGEFFRPEFIKFRYQRGLNQLGVNFGHAVNREGSDDRQVCHTDNLCIAFTGNNGNFSQFFARFAEFCFRKFNKSAVYFINNLQMARQHMLEILDRPGFQCFRKQGMVRIGKDFGYNVPGRFPVLSVNIDKQTHHFHNGKRRVGIVQLNTYRVGKLVKIVALFQKSSENILNRAGNKEILL